MISNTVITGWLNWNQHLSLGMTIVHTLTDQFDRKVVFTNPSSGGTYVMLQFQA